tara:strand:- start:369 stop:827 length:459 start_codon:yes stop_codon:yes gene_type:complete
MGLDQYAHLRNRKVNWQKYYEDDKDEQKGVFVWRKHARLQTFMNKKFEEQNKHQVEKRTRELIEKKDFNPFDCSHLGMNGDDEVYITTDVVKDLEKEIKEGYHNSFASDGFFWGQQWQEQAVKEYKAQDLEFLDYCKKAIKEGKVVVYGSSW